MSYYEEYDPYTGERSSFGGIAEAAAEYHLRGEPCPWDCYRCDPWVGYVEEPPMTQEEADAYWARRKAEDEAAEAERAAYDALWEGKEPLF